MTTSPPKSSDVRQWARNKGLEVGERGRLSPDVLAAYAAAHGGPPVKSAAKAPAKKVGNKAGKKATAKKAPARKASAKKAPSRPAAAKKAPVKATPTVASTPSAPVESAKPSFRQSDPVTGPPAVTMDSARVAALEEQISKLAARLERLEAARAGEPKRGLFSRK